MKNKSTVFKIAIMLGIAIFAFAAVSCNDPKPKEWSDSFKDIGGNTITISKAAGVSDAAANAAAGKIKDAYNGLPGGAKTNLVGKMKKIEIVAGTAFSAEKAPGLVKLGADLSVEYMQDVFIDVAIPAFAMVDIRAAELAQAVVAQLNLKGLVIDKKTGMVKTS